MSTTQNTRKYRREEDQLSDFETCKQRVRRDSWYSLSDSDKRKRRKLIHTSRDGPVEEFGREYRNIDDSKRVLRDATALFIHFRVCPISDTSVSLPQLAYGEHLDKMISDECGETILRNIGQLLNLDIAVRKEEEDKTTKNKYGSRREQQVRHIIQGLIEINERRESVLFTRKISSVSIQILGDLMLDDNNHFFSFEELTVLRSFVSLIKLKEMCLTERGFLPKISEEIICDIKPKDGSWIKIGKSFVKSDCLTDIRATSIQSFLMSVNSITGLSSAQFCIILCFLQNPEKLIKEKRCLFEKETREDIKAALNRIVQTAQRNRQSTVGQILFMRFIFSTYKMFFILSVLSHPQRLNNDEHLSLFDVLKRETSDKKEEEEVTVYDLLSVVREKISIYIEQEGGGSKDKRKKMEKLREDCRYQKSAIVYREIKSAAKIFKIIERNNEFVVEQMSIIAKQQKKADTKDEMQHLSQNCQIQTVQQKDDEKEKEEATDIEPMAVSALNLHTEETVKTATATEEEDNRSLEERQRERHEDRKEVCTEEGGVLKDRFIIEQTGSCDVRYETKPSEISVKHDITTTVSTTESDKEQMYSSSLDVCKQGGVTHTQERLIHVDTIDTNGYKNDKKDKDKRKLERRYLSVKNTHDFREDISDSFGYLSKDRSSNVIGGRLTKKRFQTIGLYRDRVISINYFDVMRAAGRTTRNLF